MLLIYFLFFKSIAFATDLTCSVNGKYILYVNGVNVSEKEFFENKVGSSGNIEKPTTVKNINDKISKYKNEIDEKKLEVRGVYNTSEGLFNDIYKLKNQLLINSGKVDKNSLEEFTTKILKEELGIPSNINTSADLQNAVSNKITLLKSESKAINYYINKKDNRDYGDQKFSDSEMYANLKLYKSQLADLIRNSISDRTNKRRKGRCGVKRGSFNVYTTQFWVGKIANA